MIVSALIVSPAIATSKTDAVRAQNQCSFSLCEPKEYAKEKVVHRFGKGSFEPFNAIVEREGQWLPTAQNPHSSAYGIAQFLDSTWGLVGYEKTSDPYVQVDAMIDYIEEVYGTPERAWSFWQAHHWY